MPEPALNSSGNAASIRLRVGRKVGRTIYQQVGDEPSDRDLLIGLVDTPEWAALIVAAVNGRDEK